MGNRHSSRTAHSAAGRQSPVISCAPKPSLPAVQLTIDELIATDTLASSKRGSLSASSSPPAASVLSNAITASQLQQQQRRRPSTLQLDMTDAAAAPQPQRSRRHSTQPLPRRSSDGAQSFDRDLLASLVRKELTSRSPDGAQSSKARRRLLQTHRNRIQPDELRIISTSAHRQQQARRSLQASPSASPFASPSRSVNSSAAASPVRSPIRSPSISFGQDSRKLNPLHVHSLPSVSAPASAGKQKQHFTFDSPPAAAVTTDVVRTVETTAEDTESVRPEHRASRRWSAFTIAPSLPASQLYASYLDSFPLAALCYPTPATLETLWSHYCPAAASAPQSPRQHAAALPFTSLLSLANDLTLRILRHHSELKGGGAVNADSVLPGYEHDDGLHASVHCVLHELSRRLSGKREAAGSISKADFHSRFGDMVTAVLTRKEREAERKRRHRNRRANTATDDPSSSSSSGNRSRSMRCSVM